MWQLVYLSRCFGENRKWFGSSCSSGPANTKPRAVRLSMCRVRKKNNPISPCSVSKFDIIWWYHIVAIIWKWKHVVSFSHAFQALTLKKVQNSYSNQTAQSVPQWYAFTSTHLNNNLHPYALAWCFDSSRVVRWSHGLAIDIDIYTSWSLIHIKFLYTYVHTGGDVIIWQTSTTQLETFMNNNNNSTGVPLWYLFTS